MSTRALDLSLEGAFRYWQRNAAVFRRVWLLSLTAWFVEPVLYLVGMGAGLGQYLEEIDGIGYLQFIAPGLLAVSAMFGATFEATWGAYFKMERQGLYAATSATPVSIEDIALGEALWAMARATIYGTAFAAVALPFGAFTSLWGLLTLPALFLVGLVFGLLGLVYTYSCKHIDYLAYYWTLFLTPMFMFAGVFFPLERLPGWLQTLAWFMPLHHATNLMRALMLEGSPADAALAALWLAVLGAALLFLPSIILRRRLVG